MSRSRHPEPLSRRLSDGVFGGVRGPEAAVAAAVVGRAERAASGVGDRAEAGRAVGDGDTDVAAALALHADALDRDPRLRSCRNAAMTSSSCALSIGQPRSSKSTGTWAAIGVELRACDVLRVRVDDARNSATSAKLRSAWMPPRWRTRRW